MCWLSRRPRAYGWWLLPRLIQNRSSSAVWPSGIAAVGQDHPARWLVVGGACQQDPGQAQVAALRQPSRMDPDGAYTAAFDPNPLVRANARRRLHDLAADTDALNFLGIASYIARAYDEARSYWTRSSDLGDTVAPLLLHLTAEPPPPAST